MAPVAVRMPNGALTSLAGNVDAGHRAGFAGAREVHAADEGVEAGGRAEGGRTKSSDPKLPVLPFGALDRFNPRLVVRLRRGLFPRSSPLGRQQH